jgi:DNA-binding transcriptional LysR family regulator
MIEDFESDIGPEITRLMATILPDCRLTNFIRVSHEILELLQDGKLDFGIATKPQFALPGVEEFPLLHDPFVLAVPAKSDGSPMDFVSGNSGLPFLRYTEGQIMGSMIAAQLKRLKISLGHDFELDSTSAIMGLIAQGGGWAITTPSNYMRSQRFQSQIKLLPFPAKEFARTISTFVANAQAVEIAKSASTSMRMLLSARAVAPVVREYPWLERRYCILADQTVTQ